MGFIRYLMNGDSRKSLKRLNHMADRVEALAPKYAPMTDAELKAQTGVLKDRLAHGETLDDILYDAFAVLREASGRVLGMRHFHVQIVGGICLFQGRVAEMKTGEGKTLVATLPAYLEALSGRGVHIVTVNDYLARRDAEWMGKVHKFMGLTVGVVVPGMNDDQKRAAYACDITYGTNNEFGFDYLRDNLKNDLKLMVQRELNFAIVDEVDSILIDEARTPLIISGKGDQSSDLYERVDKFVRTLSGGYDDELKDLEDSSRKKRKDSGAQKVAAAEALNWDYVVERKEKQVRLTEFGAEKAERYFNVDNIADVSHASLNHHIQQALKAHTLFHLNDQYIINNGEIVIVDEFTGRLMIGRRYSDGLHQAIEAKEGVKVREENKTFATITFQNYFRLYRKLSGMTGTAKTEEGEFRTIYALDVIEIPTNRPVRRDDQHDRIFATVEGKKKAIVREIVERHEKGQPILVGTVSVDKSEEISRLLIRNGVKHNILNALAALAAADGLGLDISFAAETLGTFAGVSRRFECRGMLENGARVIVDYAHHPDEISAAIDTARVMTRGEIIVFFEPHTFSRTKSLIDEFADSFYWADEVVILPTYAAREKNIEGGTAYDLYMKLKKKKTACLYMEGYAAAVDYIRSHLSGKGMILLLGAGGADKISDMLFNK